MELKILKGHSDLQNENPEQKKQMYHFKQMDDRLLLLQKHLTKKISKTRDEKLIKHYLRQCSQLAQQRLQLRKSGVT